MGTISLNGVQEGGSGGTGDVYHTRLINTTAPLTGGGDLTVDRTLVLTQLPDVSVVPFDFATTVTVGDGVFYLHIGPQLAGLNLVGIHALVVTAGVTGVSTFQLANTTTNHDMLSTALTIDSTEVGSDTAATPPVINNSYKAVSLNDILRIDVDGVSTTAPKGLIITMSWSS